MIETLMWAILGFLCFLAGPVGWAFFWFVFALSVMFKMARFVLHLFTRL